MKQLDRYLLGMSRGDDFRRKLGEDQNCYCESAGDRESDDFRLLRGSIFRYEPGGQARRCNIGNRISQENHAEESVGIGDDFPDGFGFAIT